MKAVKDYVLTIPDFPEPGIMFRDLTSVLQDADGFQLAIDEMLNLLEGVEFDVIAGAESRGFILGTPLAYNLHKPFIPIRKQGLGGDRNAPRRHQARPKSRSRRRSACYWRYDGRLCQAGRGSRRRGRLDAVPYGTGGSERSQ